jgi:hypothetical protein
MHDDRVNWRDSTRLIRHLHTFERSITQPDCFITCALKKKREKVNFLLLSHNKSTSGPTLYYNSNY